MIFLLFLDMARGALWPPQVALWTLLWTADGVQVRNDRNDSGGLFRVFMLRSSVCDIPIASLLLFAPLFFLFFFLHLGLVLSLTFFLELKCTDEHLCFYAVRGAI